ncbi:cyclase family protein [Anaerocolumna xylanovorans]|uniref:Arylformamidase n=1 Tax=Anaerocolumna xylanovorans DSM 12503 TaxID=1121345 RepID=A0A1M7Y9B6_9FIRM|nr:cyclase family protein [Anaerocolumna xylanovorans]SHO49189.1 arylformamidase [Anaerocolumna xylanovorans DSM 12503]
MKIYDITQEVFTSVVYPGDVAPSYVRNVSMDKGDVCNVTVVTMCAHNGTHMDAPFHFVKDGKAIEELNLYHCIGNCTLKEFDKQPTAEELRQVLNESQKKVILKGPVVITMELARCILAYNLELIGVESQSVAPIEAPMEVHVELLKNEVVLLEGLKLDQVEEGEYFLIAAPVKLGGSDGAPVRAILLDR